MGDRSSHRTAWEMGRDIAPGYCPQRNAAELSCRGPVKRKRALLGSNLPRNSRLETHADGPGAGEDRPAPGAPQPIFQIHRGRSPHPLKTRPAAARGRPALAWLLDMAPSSAALLRVAQIEAGDLAGPEEDPIMAIAREGAHGDAFALEGVGHAPELPVEADIALGRADGAQHVSRLVLGLGQPAWHGSRARAVAAGRDLEAEGLVRALVIVDRAPAIEGGLPRGEAAEHPHRQHLGLEGPVEALVLAPGLGMIGPAVQDIDTELEQPHAEPGPTLRRVAPGPAIVDQDRIRQAVAPKGSLDMAARRRALLVAAGLQAERIARVIVDHRQRMAPALIPHGKAPLEVHLPEEVRSRMLEATAGLLAHRRAHPAVPDQDRMDGRGRRRRQPIHLQATPDLAPAPGRMPIAHPQHRRLQLRPAAPRRAMRTARPVRRPVLALPRSPQPFVAGLGADPEPPTQLTPAHSRSSRQSHKLYPLIHDRHLAPRHARLPQLHASSVTHVSEQCYPCLRAIHSGLASTSSGAPNALYLERPAPAAGRLVDGRAKPTAVRFPFQLHWSSIWSVLK